ncbi:MAG: thioredoxin family protein [Planctomycetota bacterium]|jgi:thiol:disulfide interchange protein
MTRPIAIVVACASLLLAGSVHGRQAPPATAGATPAQDQRPDIYDETADARAVIDAAVARARKDNKHVLVQWGANWCGWCHLLHQHFRDQREVARKLLYEYEVVLVDVGRFDRNMELATSLGAELRGNGIPFLTVLDGEGRPLANQPTGPLEAKIDGRPGHDPDKVLAFLTRHQAPPLAAESVLAAARDRAAKEGKLVFLHFGAPWCA